MYSFNVHFECFNCILTLTQVHPWNHIKKHLGLSSGKFFHTLFPFWSLSETFVLICRSSHQPQLSMSFVVSGLTVCWQRSILMSAASVSWRVTYWRATWWRENSSNLGNHCDTGRVAAADLINNWILTCLSMCIAAANENFLVSL